MHLSRKKNVVIFSVINLSHSPFIRILWPFATGIAMALSVDIQALWMLYAAFGLLLIYVPGVLFRVGRSTYRRRWYYGVLIHLVLFLAGYQLVAFRSASTDLDGDLMSAGMKYRIVQLDDAPVEKPGSFKTTGRHLAFCDSTGWDPVPGKVLIYFARDDAVRSLRYGDRILMQSDLREVKGPENPGAFNYKRYLRFSGIHVQTYIRSGQWVKVSSGEGSRLIAISKRARDKLLGILRSAGLEGEEFALASAILLGYDEFLDPEQRKQFAGAGAMHILCVSGLHVGIIAVVLNSLLFFLVRNKTLKFIKLILLIIMIWSYAAITGFSPSVMRAATMFSFIYAGRTFKRTVSIYNMLAASAFILLVVDPFMLTRVGFQLSYLAVTGIVLLFKPLCNLLHVPVVLLDKAWQLSVVSLAATLATFPLSLYYFHQFPNLFLLTNLVAIPASFLILYNGILLLAFSTVPLIADVLGYTFLLVLSGLGRAVGFLEGLPFSTTTGVYLSTPQLLLLMGLLVSMVILFLSRRKGYLFIMLTLSLLLSLSALWRKYASHRQSHMVAYSIRGHTALEFIQGTRSVFVCDSALLHAPRKIDYATSGFRLQQGITHTSFHALEDGDITTPWFKRMGSMFFFGGQLLVLVDDNTDFYRDSVIVNTDWVLLCKKPGTGLEKLSEVLVFDSLILDGSMPPWVKERWMASCREMGLEFHDLAENGAYIQSGLK